jgi:predicted phage terminase large subunit-like protein
MPTDENNILIELKAKLWGSLLLFTQVFFKERTGREFRLSHPVSQESHFITICRQLTRLFRLETKRLIINVPPGFAKSELCIHFIAWAMSRYPDCNFMYISYSKNLAAKHTYTIKRLMELPLYKRIFGVELAKDSKAKDNFRTTAGGSVMAFGSGGSIGGQDAGLPHLDRFSGIPIYDDPHNIEDVHSDVMREKTINNYNESVKARVIRSGSNVGMLVVGQRLREEDLSDYLEQGKDGSVWDIVKLPGRDEHGNILYPELHTKETLDREQEFNPYFYFSQIQQQPQPAGGSVFKPEWFYCTDYEPKIIDTFITADTAETEKNYNDATVFSFWGTYYVQRDGIETDILGLHWIDCLEIRIDPKDLMNEFLSFYTLCMSHKIKPRQAVIEGKSTGTTLLSVLKSMQGLRVTNVNTSNISPSQSFSNKTVRFLQCQPYVAEQLISLPQYGKHTKMCIEHCKKITANDTHRFDDIADTMCFAIRAALIDQSITRRINTQNNENKSKIIMSGFKNMENYKKRKHIM